MYESLCQNIKNKVEVEVGRRGISCDIYARTKEPDSLLKKALRKNYDDPYEGIQDKAGVRVVSTYQDSLLQLEDIIKGQFEVCNYENKSIALGYDRLGYPGIHFEVKLRPETEGADSKLSGMICEIQLLTRAQSLWADISHELAYKPAQEPPDEIKRAINLQCALVELFDNQMTQARKLILDLQGFQEANMLDALDKHFFRFTAEQYDRELSLHIIDRLRPMFSSDDLQVFGNLLDAFVEQKKEVIDTVFKSYADDSRRNPLLFQPESILIFMCMDRDVFRLKELWRQFYPLDLLQGLAETWGLDIGVVP